MRRRRVVIGVCGTGALVLAACATPGFSPTRVQSELVRAGTTPAQAKCVTDGLRAKIDLKALGSHSPPFSVTTTVPSSVTTTVASTVPPAADAVTTTTEVDEYLLTRRILKSCGVKLPLQPPP